MNFTFGLNFGSCFQGETLPSTSITLGGQTIAIGNQIITMSGL